MPKLVRIVALSLVVAGLGVLPTPVDAAVGATVSGTITTTPTTIQWLRGDQVVGTGSTYVVQAADAGQQLQARATGVRPDAVPGSARGDPVSFVPGRATSTAVAVAADPDGPGPTPPGPGPGDGDPTPGASAGSGGSGAGALARTGAQVVALVALGALLLGLGGLLTGRNHLRRAPHPRG